MTVNFHRFHYVGSMKKHNQVKSRDLLLLELLKDLITVEN